MVVGGISSIFKVRKGLKDAIKILFESQKKASLRETPLSQRDISARAINLFSILAVILVGSIYYHITGDLIIMLMTTVIMIIMSFFFTAVASYIVGLVGNSNSPVSGLSLIHI